MQHNLIYERQSGTSVPLSRPEPPPTWLERAASRAIRVALGLGGLIVIALIGAAVGALYGAFVKWSIGV